MIYFTSDLHLCHDREFVWKSRGFSSCDEMNNVLINNIIECVNKDDTLYILGDVGLGQDTQKIVDYLNKIPCEFVLIR